jgi:glycosyltransferase involved in cell wall biosynthesis
VLSFSLVFLSHFVKICIIFGYVLIEAMVKKLPVIAFRVGGIPEIVQHGKSGYLIDFI